MDDLSSRVGAAVFTLWVFLNFAWVAVLFVALAAFFALVVERGRATDSGTSWSWRPVGKAALITLTACVGWALVLALAALLGWFNPLAGLTF